MSELTDYIESLLASGWSYRDFERKSSGALKRGAIESLLAGKKTRMETFALLAETLELPLWRIVQMAGYNLQLGKSIDEKSKRLVEMAKIHPGIELILDRLLQLDPQNIAAVLALLEGQKALSKQGNPPTELSDQSNEE